MEDVIVEPVRSILIPLYHEVKQSALDAGALGCNISGSGPSIFSLCKGHESAERVLTAIKSIYENSGLDVHYHISPINAHGAHVIS